MNQKQVDSYSFAFTFDQLKLLIFFFLPQIDWANVIQNMILDVEAFTKTPPTVISIGRDAIRQLNKLLINK